MSKQSQKLKTKKLTTKKPQTSVNKKVSVSLYQRFYIIKKPVVIISAFLLLIFLIINILGSQTISPLYFSVLNEDKNAVVIYLRKIIPLPFFQTELNKYKIIYGKSLESQVFAEKYQRQKQIIILETLLQKNPEARDVLFALYQLYLNDEQMNKAREYLKRAQLIDPMIK